MSDTADWIERKHYTCVWLSVCSGCNLPCCLCFCSGSGEDSLDRLLPPAGAPRRKSATSLSKTEPPLLRTGTRTIYTAGRPPWYDEHGAQSKEAFVIGMMMFFVFFSLLLTVFLFSPPSCQTVAPSCRTCPCVTAVSLYTHKHFAAIAHAYRQTTLDTLWKTHIMAHWNAVWICRVVWGQRLREDHRGQ